MYASIEINSDWIEIGNMLRERKAFAAGNEWTNECMVKLCGVLCLCLCERADSYMNDFRCIFFHYGVTYYRHTIWKSVCGAREEEEEYEEKMPFQRKL